MITTEKDTSTIADVETKLKEVATHLNLQAVDSSVYYDRLCIRGTLANAPIAEIALRYGQYPERIEINGYTNRERDLGTPAPCITVGARRGMKDIVKEIERRLMPKLLVRAHLAAEKQRRHEEYQRQKAAAFKRLRPGDPTERDRFEEDLRLDIGDAWVVVRYGDDDHLSFEMHGITLDQADQVLTVLRENPVEENDHVG